MKSRTSLETRSDVGLHTYVAEMSVVPVGGSRYFVTFIDEVSGHVSAFHMKTKAEAATLLKHLAKLAKRQTEGKVKKSSLVIVGNI